MRARAIKYQNANLTQRQMIIACNSIIMSNNVLKITRRCTFILYCWHVSLKFNKIMIYDQDHFFQQMIPFTEINF